MTEAEVHVRAARLADALLDTDPAAIRAALAGITPLQANRVVRAAAALNGGRLRIG
ncbi:hypothetical protein SAMN05216360_10338 [Methylobacterium phyllostachyos]|uniref:Uncharacterized protein n=1 Tax=Methylobacterium phyllostachyos TaxID=582672 RepID=A0A1G9V2B9_9HYPH|nr:hypothetical protein [Methylobacterium phyllostachyos]SDM66025.1 hypothetical protein SAMN05216360_10338 [Methylobacterium phyllostachyos]